MHAQSSAPASVREQITARWIARRDEWARLGASLNGSALAEDVLADLRALAEAEEGELLNLTQAAGASGYSADHLGREIREGRIPNAGRLNRPLVRRGDLPRKPGYLPRIRTADTIDRKRIALATVHDSTERRNG